MTKVLIVPGSVRSGSFNVRLGRAICKQARARGAEADLISLGDYPMPIFNQNDETLSGVPQGARDLAALIAGYQAVVLVSPEYNASLPPVLKNALDWLSRDVGVQPYKDRIFALAACSPGGLGGIRAMSHMRDILVSIGAEVITPQLAVGNAGSAFTDDDDLTNERAIGLLQNLCETLINRAKLLA